MARQLQELNDTVPLVKLKIPRAGHASDYFVISIPRVTPHTPPWPGHTIHVFHMYNIMKEKKVLLKDP